MTRTRILVAALATLALAAPAASADPHAIDAHARAELEKQDLRSADAIDSAVQAELLRARGGDGAITGGVAPTNAITRALEKEKAYSSYGEPAPLEPTAPQVADDDDGTPWPLIATGFLGIALLFGAAVALVARPRRARVAA